MDRFDDAKQHTRQPLLYNEDKKYYLRPKYVRIKS